MATHSANGWAPVAPLGPIDWAPLATLTAPALVLSWLAESGSLTRRLRGEPGPLTLVCLQQGVVLAEQSWQRQVLLLKAGRPWVWALTQAPAATLRQHPELARQGERPLGDWLFGEGGGRRSSLQWADLAAEPALVQALRAWRITPPDRLWARYSRFELSAGHCTITELFLPGSPLYAEPVDEVSVCKR